MLSLSILGSTQDLVLEFLTITRIKREDVAEKVLVNAEWDIKGAVDLYNLAKNDDELKDMFQLENEYKMDESGKSICFIGHVLNQIIYPSLS